LAVFIDLEIGLLEVPHDPLRELLAGIVGSVLFQEPAEEIAAARQGEADRKHEVIAERPWMHAGDFCS
jgi:hypothetical protein